MKPVRSLMKPVFWLMKPVSKPLQLTDNELVANPSNNTNNDKYSQLCDPPPSSSKKVLGKR